MASSAPDARLETLPQGEIRAVFDAIAPQHRDTLLDMRALIHDVARHTEAVGEITETLKWGEPSYTPARPRIGSSVRLGVARSGQPALFFICHGGLVDRFREIYGNELEFEGNRAILLPQGTQPNDDALRHCIALALTWHIARRQA